jgi:hypothetical protein
LTGPTATPAPGRIHSALASTTPLPGPSRWGTGSILLCRDPTLALVPTRSPSPIKVPFSYQVKVSSLSPVHARLELCRRGGGGNSRPPDCGVTSRPVPRHLGPRHNWELCSCTSPLHWVVANHHIRQGASLCTMQFLRSKRITRPHNKPTGTAERRATSVSRRLGVGGCRGCSPVRSWPWSASFVAVTLGRGSSASTVADLARTGPSDRVVDVGCGSGTAARLAGRRGSTATGIDPSPWKRPSRPWAHCRAGGSAPPGGEGGRLLGRQGRQPRQRGEGVRRRLGQCPRSPCTACGLDGRRA